MQADFLMGVSLLKREDESLYEYWLSFSPMAPIFGVTWRFAPAATEGVAAATPKTAARPAPGKAAAAAPQLELVAAATPAPKAAVEPAPAKTPEPKPEAAEAAAAEAQGTQAVKPATLYDPAPARPDDLKAIKGVGPKLEAELNGLGLYTYAQIAALSPENLVWIDDHLTSFKGRSVRDDWIGQAEALTKA